MAGDGENLDHRPVTSADGTWEDDAMTYATEVFADAGREYGRRLADQVAEYVNAKVETALALERDRYEELIGGLIRACEALSERIDALEGAETNGHSVRADLLTD